VLALVDPSLPTSTRAGEIDDDRVPNAEHRLEQGGKEPVEGAEIVARAVVEHVQLPGEAGPREIH